MKTVDEIFERCNKIREEANRYIQRMIETEKNIKLPMDLTIHIIKETVTFRNVHGYVIVFGLPEKYTVFAPADELR